MRKTQVPPRRRVRSRGVPPALDGREIFYTEDILEANALLSRVFGPCRVTPARIGPDPFAVRMHGVRLRDTSLLYLDLHDEAGLDISESGPYYAVLMPMNGRVRATVGGRHMQATTIGSLVLNPGDRAMLSLDHDAPVLIVRIEQEAFERHLSRLIGRSLTHRLAFDHEFDLTTEVAMRWHGAVQMLHTEVFYAGSLVRSGQGIGPLEEFVMSSLLLVQPSTYTDLLRADTRKPGRRAVRTALDYIEAHLSETISMTDLAEHAGVSARTIQQGFREELATSPVNYIRDRRLERARQDLFDAEPGDGMTVTMAAERWGFNHLGSFAVIYRKRYGESPSETLRR